jgi:tripartite-type tricarboxylate transporter receptor subunit TctC
VIENKPGGGFTIGLDIVAKAAPDGYTIGMGPIGAMAISPNMMSRMPYDVERDIQPVSMVTKGHLLLAVSPQLPINSVSELIAYAKKNPGKLTYGSAGLGSGTHFMGEHFKQLTGTDILHVPYKSTQLATQDVAGGRIDIAFEGSVKPYVDSGKVRIIAVTDVNRDPRFPNIPTVSEAGLPEFTFASWLGLFAPNGLTDKQIMRLNQALNEATSDISVKRRLSDMGLTATVGPPNLLRSQIKDDLIRYKKIAATVKIKIQ